MVDFLRYLDDGFLATLERLAELWFTVCFLLEHKGREECDDFFGLESGTLISFYLASMKVR